MTAYWHETFPDRIDKTQEPTMPDSSDGITVKVDIRTPDAEYSTGRCWIAFDERVVGHRDNVRHFADLATALDRTARVYWRGGYGPITKPVAWHSHAGQGLWRLHDANGHTGVAVITAELLAAAEPAAPVEVMPALPDEREQSKARSRKDHDDFVERERANAQALNDAYRERAHLVALLAAQYSAQLGHDPQNLDYSIVYVELPTGQASWHLHDRDLDLFPHLKYGTDAEWDGHTTEEKYRRIDELTAAIAAELRDHPLIVVDFPAAPNGGDGA